MAPWYHKIPVARDQYAFVSRRKASGTTARFYDIMALVSRRRKPVEDLLSVALHFLAGATLAVFHFVMDAFVVMGDEIIGLFRKKDDSSD
jgi:hypothetical protein